MEREQGGWNDLPHVAVIELRRPASRFAPRKGLENLLDDTEWLGASAWIVCPPADFEAFQEEMRGFEASFEREFAGWIQSATSGLGPKGKDEALALTRSWTLLPRSLPGEREEKSKEEFVANEQKDWERVVGRFQTWAAREFGARAATSVVNAREASGETPLMIQKTKALREAMELGDCAGAPARKGPGGL